MANKYADWMTNTLGIAEAAPPPEAGVMGYVSPTFKPKFKTAAEAAKAAGQTNFTPEPYEYVKPASTNKRIADYSTVPGGMNAVKYGGMAPMAEAAKIVYSEASKTPAQRGAEFQAAYNGTTPSAAPVVQPAVKPATTTPSQVARTGTGIYMDGQELKKQIGGGVITDSSRVNPLGMQYQQMQGAGEYGAATNAIGTRAGSNRVVNVDPNVAAAYNRPEVGQRTSGGGIYLGKASEQPERQSTPLSALPGNRYNELMSKWREASGPYNPREREATRVAQARQVAQNEQANVAGEREAGIRQIEAEQKAKGEIGKATEAQRGAMELAKQQGINAKDAATIRAEVGSEGIDAKAIIAGLQSEDENVRKLASEKFMKMFGATAGVNQSSISVDDARAQAKAAGKKQFKLGGKVYDV